MERLWGRADLQTMLAGVASTAQLRAALTTSLRQHLTNKRRRSIASNLYKRVLAMLRDISHFRPVTGSSLAAERRWTLAENEPNDPSFLPLHHLFHLPSNLTNDD